MRRKSSSTESVHEPARRRLLDGAAELFTRKGYSAATVREIVAAAGVTKPVLYYYFRSKEGIYLELMREAFAKMDELLSVLPGARGSATRKLLRLCDQTYSLFMENVKVARVMYAIYYGPQQGAPFFDFDAYHVRFIEAIRRIVAEGIRKGEFRKGNPEEISWAIIGAVNVAMEVHLGHTELELGREGLARVLKLIFQGIGAHRRRRK
jgi:TetR/AcrR family transcriptional regulator